MVGPGALPLKPHKSTVLLGAICCFTGSAIKWNTFTPLSTVKGKSLRSGDSTRAGDSAATARRADSSPAPAPNALRQKLRRLLINLSLQNQTGGRTMG